jgi:hypothetical protein
MALQEDPGDPQVPPVVEVGPSQPARHERVEKLVVGHPLSVPRLAWST